MTGTPETLTRAELAEALDSEQFGLNSSYAGGRELAVNVFAYVEAHRAPLVFPPDESAAVKTVAEMAQAQPLLAEALERALVRAEAAEAKLAAVESLCRERVQNPECPECGRGETLMKPGDILAITGSGEEVPDDRSFDGPVL